MLADRIFFKPKLSAKFELITDHDNTQIIEDGRTITVIPAYIWLIDK